MSEKIVLSIIIPLYNGKEFIKETVDSLLKINISKEILIIDDGSSDDSYFFCKKLYGMNQCIQLLSKKNSGIVDTRNYGLKYAKGEYILFSDHDDLSFHKTIEKATNIAIQENLDFVFWSTTRYIGDGRQIECDTIAENQFVDETCISNMIQCMLLNLPYDNCSYIGHLWSGIYKKSVIENRNIKFKKFVDIEDDYLFVFDFLMNSAKGELIKDVGYSWRYNLKSETYKAKIIKNIFLNYNKLYSYLFEEISARNFDEKFLIKFRKHSIQNIVVMCMENMYKISNKDFKSRKELKNFYIINRKEFISDSVQPYKFRRKRIYWFLKNGMYLIAGLYVSLDSVYRSIKRGKKFGINYCSGL